MLRSAIISPDRDLAADLQRALDAVGRAYVVRTMDQYPTAVELTRFIRAHAPQVVFLSIQSMAKATDAIQRLQESSPGVQVIAIHRSYEPQLLLDVMRAGIREFLALPFDHTTLTGALERLKDALARRPLECDATDLVYAFLPSKAGVGTSTIALNTAVALSTTGKARTLLTDFDLNSGMIRFMLKLDNQYSIVDAAERALEIDENFWPQLVTSIGNLDCAARWRVEPELPNGGGPGAKYCRLRPAELQGNVHRSFRKSREVLARAYA